MKKPDPGTMIAAVNIGVLFLLFGIITPMYAQREQHDQDAKQPGQERQQQARPQKQQQKAQPANQEQKPQARPQKQQQKAQPAKQEQKQQTRPEKQEQQTKLAKQEQQQPQQAKQPSQQVQHVKQSERRGVWQQHRAQNWQAEHHTWQERGGYDGYRIPDDHFHGYFGRDYGFRINSLSLEIFGGHPSFKYNGYWFSFIDPWPEYWSDDWYENDDVYIDYYNDGYYLYNRRYPGVGIAISVFVN